MEQRKKPETHFCKRKRSRKKKVFYTYIKRRRNGFRFCCCYAPSIYTKYKNLMHPPLSVITEKRIHLYRTREWGARSSIVRPPNDDDVIWHYKNVDWQQGPTGWRSIPIYFGGCRARYYYKCALMMCGTPWWGYSGRGRGRGTPYMVHCWVS